MRFGTKSIGLGLLSLTIAAGWLTHAVGQPGTTPLSNLPDTSVRPSDNVPPGCLQVVSEPDHPLAAVVYDPQQQVLGVYHVDRVTGEIELKSIRQIQWDLQLLHWHGKEPLPQDIKNDLEAMDRR